MGFLPLVWAGQSERCAKQSCAASAEASFVPVAEALLRFRLPCKNTVAFGRGWSDVAGLLSCAVVGFGGVWVVLMRGVAVCFVGTNLFVQKQPHVLCE